MFNPAFMTMSGWSTPANKQPWAYGAPYTDINRKYLKLRERLLPYFYTYAAEAHRTGAPLNRSLNSGARASGLSRSIKQCSCSGGRVGPRIRARMPAGSRTRSGS